MSFKLNNKIIKNFNTPYIIAEVGANFNGDLDIAKKMITMEPTLLPPSRQ